MVDIKCLVILILLSLSDWAHAGYAQLKPPVGWSSAGVTTQAGHAGNFTFGPAANGGSFKGGTVLTNASLNVGGQLVTMPASMRMAANAGALAATFSFGNPYLFLTIAAGSAIHQYFSSGKVHIADGHWVEDVELEVPGTWYQVESMPDTMWFITKGAACGAMNGYSPNEYGSWVLSSSGSRCQAPFADRGFQEKETVVHTNQTRAMTPERFKEIMDPVPIPDDLPLQWPSSPDYPQGFPWPVEKPVVNPDPAITPRPSPSPDAVPRPLNIPTGIPVPTADPDKWNQPVVRVTPAPTPDNPWRVDLAPQDVPQSTSTPKTFGQLQPSSSGSQGVPKAETPPGLCDQYPDILACQKLDSDTPAEDGLQTKDKAITITPDTGWGASGGTCPAGRTLSHGAVYSFQPVCDFAAGVKPVLIAVAWLGAGMLLLGFKGGS
jgi:hypothetical protein